MKERFPGHGKMLGLVATGAMAFGGAGCADANIPKFGNFPTETPTAASATPTPSESAGTPTPKQNEQPPIVAINSKGEFLDLPFPKNLDIKIQQAWSSRLDPDHKAVDYIYGEKDLSETWKKFSILAAAAGLACVNPPNRLGTAIFIEHHLSDGRIGYTYYGHLSQIDKNIPDCSTGNKSIVQKGQEIGISGDTGATKGWDHLHFSVILNGPADPYGLKLGERDMYPDPNFKNGKICAEGHLFIGCPTEPNLAIELRYADGKPIYNQRVYIFSVAKDIDGNPKPDKQIKDVSTGELGLIKADVLTGEYILLFEPNSKVRGPRLTESDSRPGLPIKVGEVKTDRQKVTLGRASIEIKDKDEKPSGNASACLNDKDVNGKVYQVVCADADDKTGVIVIDALPANYTARVQVGKTSAIFLFGRAETPQFQLPVKSGEIKRVNCSIDFGTGHGTCTIPD